MPKKRKMPVVGQVYNHLRVIERGPNYVAPSGKAEFSQWWCECDCGNRILVLGSSLTTGHTKSCGCLSRRYKVSDEVMLHKRFGLLVVDSRAPSHKIPSGSVYDMWNCTCDCGKKTVSFGRQLRNGHASSCGCQRVIRQAEAKWTPKAEIWAKQYFNEHDIDYAYQQTFPNLTGANNGLLSYDFYLADYNLLLELNGLQHYKPVDWFGGETTFKQQVVNDQTKRNYAEEHGYRLYVIDTDHISEKQLIGKLDKMLSEI